VVQQLLDDGAGSSTQSQVQRRASSESTPHGHCCCQTLSAARTTCNHARRAHRTHIIEAPWLVSGGHGASFNVTSGARVEHGLRGWVWAVAWPHLFPVLVGHHLQDARDPLLGGQEQAQLPHLRERGSMMP
jgi:hypothetical protein